MSGVCFDAVSSAPSDWRSCERAWTCCAPPRAAESLKWHGHSRSSYRSWSRLRPHTGILNEDRDKYAPAALFDAERALGLVHRDLKLANTMLATAGPRLLDSGIAAIVDGTSPFSATSTGAVIRQIVDAVPLPGALLAVQALDSALAAAAGQD